MIEVGTYLRVETETHESTFGTCVWEIIETGLPVMDGDKKRNDGVKSSLVGGSGPAAKSKVGMTVIESWRVMKKDIASGKSVPVSKREAMAFGDRQEKGPSRLLGQEVDL